MGSLKRCNFVEEKSLRTGSHLDVLALLCNNGKTRWLVRSNGDPVSFDIVGGKHLLICCVTLPLDNDSYDFRSMIDAYNNIPPDKFEMLIVATSDVDEPAFDSFFNTLPCLAIPFSDTDTRNSISRQFNSLCYHKVSAVLLDPDQIILHCFNTPCRFLTYGYEWFPFRESDKEAIITQDHVLRFRLDPLIKKGVVPVPDAVMRDPQIGDPLSLYRDILLCDPSLVLTRNGHYQPLTVSELSQKLVGLYLCVDAHFLFELITVHQECVANKLEFEIIVIYVPILEDIQPLREAVVRDLRHHNVTSWFVLSEPSKVWRRLWRAFSMQFPEDRLIILPPNGYSGELQGRAIINQLGITEYPFTRSTILERRFTCLRSLTPASLFQGTSKNRTCLVRKGKKLNVRQSTLEGKKLLVYLDWLLLSNDNGKLCDLLRKLYPKIKAMGWEVVFVPLDYKDGRRRHVKFAKMLWPIMPVYAAVQANVTSQLIFEGEGYGNQIIAFREDGKIVSREVQKRLRKHLLNDSLFYDNLYEEITADLVFFSG